jgi:hypothetical protein
MSTNTQEAEEEVQSNEDTTTNFVTQGANIWQQNWLFASRKGKESITQTHSHDDWVASQVHAHSDTCLYRWGNLPRRASCLTNKTHEVRKIKLLWRH